MNRLLAFFYARSLPVRLVLVACALVSVSLVIAAAGVAHLVLLVNRPGGSGPEFWPFSEKTPTVHEAGIQPPPVRDLLQRCEDLGEWLAEHGHGDQGTYPYRVASLTPDELAHLRGFVASGADCGWPEILAFAARDTPRPFPAIFALTPVPTLFADLLPWLKTTDPETDVVPAVTLLLRYSVILSLGRPGLLSKLRETAVTAALDRGLHRLCAGGLLTATEAAVLLAEVKRADAIRLPLAEAWEREVAELRQWAQAVWKRAPLGCFILDRTLGDPIDALAPRIQAVRAPPTTANLAALRALPKHLVNRLGDLYLPDYWTECYVAETRRAIVKQELAARAGSAEVFTDPFTGGPLLRREVGERVEYYSPGPNLSDDALAGDDIGWAVAERTKQ